MGNFAGKEALKNCVHDLKISRLEEDRTAVYETLSCVLKTREDRARISREVADRLIGKVA